MKVIFFFQGKELSLVWVMILYGLSTTRPVFIVELENESDGNGQYLRCLYRFLLKKSIRSGRIPNRDRVIVPFLWKGKYAWRKEAAGDGSMKD